MDLKQSLILSLCKTKMCLYETRLLVKIVEHGQVALQGLFLQENLTHIPFDKVPERINVPIKDILPDGNQHYEQAITAASSMCSRMIEFWDVEKKKWGKSAIIFDAVHDSGVLSFSVSNLFWKVLFDFTRGFSWYELSVALSLPTPAAIRMYMFVNGQSHPIQRSIQQLKDMLMCPDSYSQTADFIKRVVDPAKEALDAAGGNSFTYKRIVEGRKVVALQLTPIVKRRMHHQPADKSKFWSAMVSQEIKSTLLSFPGFTAKSLQSHAQLIELLSSHPQAAEILQGVIHRARIKDRKPGWVIAALRSELGVS